MSTKYVPLEEEECFNLIQWGSLHPICKDHLIHIANEGKTSFFYGKKLKKMGKKPGVSDYFLSYPCHGKSGLWIEMKRHKYYTFSQRKEWSNQINFLRQMKSIGYSSFIAFGFNQAINIITAYLNNQDIDIKMPGYKGDEHDIII